jgi:hypothetical protein
MKTEKRKLGVGEKKKNASSKGLIGLIGAPLKSSQTGSLLKMEQKY